jgi:hypothetical protein
VIVQPAVQRHESLRHLLAHGGGAVPRLDGEVLLEEVDHRPVRGRLAVRDRGGVQHAPAGNAGRTGDLPDEPGLADAGLARDGDHLPVAAGDRVQRPAELLQLAPAPDEPGQSAGRRRVEARPQRPGPDQLVHVDRLAEPLHAHRPQRLHLDVALGEAQRAGREAAAARAGELFHPGRDVRGLADGGVVQVQVAADGAHHDLARVEPDPDLDRDTVGASDAVGPGADGGVHVEGRVAGPHRVILVRQRRPEERHDPVAHDLVDRALVAVHGLDHPLQDRVEQLAGLFRVAVGQQLGRALEVGEQHRHLLALALERGPGLEDALGQVPGRVAHGGREAARPRRSAALRAELGRGRQPVAAVATRRRQRRAARLAERSAGLVVVPAAGTGHAGRAGVDDAACAPRLRARALRLGPARGP